MTDRAWLPQEDWYASLATSYVAAGALITDVAGRVLLVKPNYRPYWAFPGGVLEHAEAPHAGCAREVREELGLDMVIGALLVAGWAPPLGLRPRPIMYLLFDGGVVPDDARVRLQRDELDDYAFVSAGKGAELLDGLVADRLAAALRARQTGRTEYLAVDPAAG
jgi:8-oxo-dGTP diphosphatase